MSTDFRNVPSFSFVLYLSLAAFGSYLLSSSPLNSSRPVTRDSSIEITPQEHKIPARLWQDPFRVIEANRDKIKKLEQPGQIRKKLVTYAKNSDVLIIAAMMAGEPYAEEEERRRRRRYAVISGLAVKGFYPEDTMNIHAMPVRYGEQDNMVPYEWFHAEDESGKPGHQHVLVMWLDENDFSDTPFLTLKTFIDSVFFMEGESVVSITESSKLKGRTRLLILGPARSSTLKKLAAFNENDDEKKAITALKNSGLAGINFLSPVATIPDEYLGKVHMDERVRQGSAAKGSSLFATFSPQHCREEMRQTCLTFQRGILTDDVVIERLVGELALRRISQARDSRVVLISEMDTVFGRTLPELFSKQYCGQENCKMVTRLTYMRGIDGRAIDTPDIGKKTSEKSRSAGEDDLFSESSTRRPVGTAQFDYMRRLAEKIRRLDEKVMNGNGRGIDAIGVLGSDVYDKLLILRLLRQQIPGVQFFSTDLDAEVLHPNEYQWARNLIGSSTYVLQLDSEHQKMVPPFRDSYQTSFFWSTQNAVDIFHHDNSSISENMLKNVQPILYEVGRHGAVLLPSGADIPAAVNLPELTISSQSTISDMNRWLPFLMLIIVGACLIGYYQGKNSYQLVWYLASSGLLVIILVVAASLGQREEPLVLFSGVSIWASEVIRMSVILLALYFIIDSALSLKMNWLRLDRDFMNRHPRDLPNKCRPMEIIRAPIDGKGEGNSVTEHCDEIRKMPFLLFAIVLAAIFEGVLEFYAVSQWYIFVLWLLFFIIWFVLSRYMKYFHFRNWQVDICQPVGEEPYPDARKLWLEYGEHTCLKSRIIRTFNMVLVFKIMVSLVHILFGQERAPIRGELSLMVDKIISVPAELLILFLLFFIVDATFLCNTWIKAFTFNRYDWEHTRAREIADKLAVNCDDILCWLKIKLIASRTREVNRLIYFPVLIIILMLFSRISFFDNWGFPQAQALVVGTTIVIALLTALHLRKVAEKARRRSLKELNRKLIQANAGGTSETTDDGVMTSAQQVALLVEQVENIRSGAFQPIFEQPFVKAGLLLLGGIGFTASQYYSLLGG